MLQLQHGKTRIDFGEYVCVVLDLHTGKKYPKVLLYRCEDKRKRDQIAVTFDCVVLRTAVKTALSLTVMVCVVCIRTETKNIKY